MFTRFITIAVLIAADPGAVALDPACIGSSCDTLDSQALLQAKVHVHKEELKTIETVDDIDMEAMGLRAEFLDKATTKIIEGVPVFGYADAYGSLEPTLLEMTEAKEWILQFPPTTSDAKLKEFCSRAQGNGACVLEGHPDEGGVADVVFKGSHAELQAVLSGFSPKPQFAEADKPVTIVPEVDVHDLTLEEEAALIEGHAQGTPASWGLDRIDDISAGVDQSYTLPSASKQGDGAHVYVVDTGIHTAHPDFEGRAVSFLDCCPSGYGCGACTQCSPSDTTCANDGNMHGTHCAGTIGGKVYGVAKKTKLYAVKVLADNGGGSFAGIVASIDWVASYGNKPAVWSGSLGGKGVMNSIETSFQAANRAGVVISVAAGNDNDDACGYSPAFAPSAITVGATGEGRFWNQKDARAGFSNYGTCVDIFAPGVDIISAGHTGGSKSLSGTSMACPHVSGAAALFMADMPSLKPDASGDKLWDYMKGVAIAGTVSDENGSPNLMLYVGASPSPVPPGASPSPVPQGKPTCSGKSCSNIGITAGAQGQWIVSRGKYGNNEKADIALNGPGTVRFNNMGTESGYDWLKFPDGTKYMGRTVPTQPISVSDAGSVVQWTSDASAAAGGWMFTFTPSATTGCTDTAGWVDSDNGGCALYQSCQPNDAWKTKGDAYYAQWAVNGVSARDACCACGKTEAGPSPSV